MKERNNTDKYVLLLFIAVMASGMLLGWLLRGQKSPVIEEKFKTDTLVIRDTILRTEPFMVTKRIKEIVEVPIVDTLTIRDTLYARMERHEVAYSDDTTYYAVVSGIEPSLDTLRIYLKSKVVTNTIVRDVKSPARLGISAMLGYGYSYGVNQRFSPYIGIGFSYQIISFDKHKTQ